MKGRALFVAGVAALGYACSPAPQTNLPEETASPSGKPGPDGTATAHTPAANAPFENPGGMWLPEQLALQADTFKKVGFSIDPMMLTKPTEFPLGAVVSLGGCSASFVSPDGLIITNHHCVIGALQVNSKEGKANLLKDGYLAKTRNDELSAGPAARVYVTQSMKDVTTTMRDGLATMKDDMARYQAIEDRTKKLVADCEKGRDGLRCSVASFFGGGEFRLIEQLEIRDVRLVYAPPEGVGNFGGEIDNWRWPRHSGDFSFYRAYVGKDGKPADNSDKNVPYRPTHVLKLAKDPLGPGDAVMVAGYPARTSRLTTAVETREAVNSDLPYTVDYCEAYLAELEAVKKADPKVAIKAEPFVRGLANTLTNVKGQIEGLSKGGLAEKKAAEEAELKKWIEAVPARKAKFKDSVDEAGRLVMESRKAIDADRTMREIGRLSRAYWAAYTIVRNAEERAKDDALRDPDYQERNQKRLEQSFKQMTLQYSPAIDAAMLRLATERELKHPVEKRAGLGDAILGKRKPTELSAAIKGIYDKTKVGDEAARLKLLTKATVAELEKSTDPMIKLALALRPKSKDMEERDKKLTGALLLVRPLFVGAMQERLAGKLAPDANGTLRITYGTVRGYAPKPGAPVFTPFTVLSEVVKKNTGKDPFEAPQALLDAVSAKKFGPYVDPKLGEVPVNFLADLDISGGNSGSATLNARGELVGLAFDGNYESMASNWIFMPEVTRSIHVDLRYALWVMDAVSNADNLLREMGIEPAVQ
ncbi:MAG: S46 family peptidase [Polyangiaceae bacterium]|nr:S46 family peptidase [Polyangiaceae bacterium]